MAKKKASRTVGLAIVALLIVALLGFGVTNFGGSVRSVGTVGGTEIDTRTYARQLQQELRVLSREMQSNMTLTQARTMGLDQAVLGRLIGEAAIENEAAELGISVGDETVGDQVVNLREFQSAGGFNRETYRLVLENAGLSIAEFEDQVRADTSRNIVQAAVVAGLQPQPIYAETFFNWARETRDITWAIYGPNVFTDAMPEASDADLAEFHETNADRFTLPETRVFSYALLTPEMILDSIETDESELREVYEDRRDEYIRPERRLVERLVFSTTEEAQAARDAIDAGETTFEETVEARGLAIEDIDLGDVEQSDLGAAGDAVFALEDTGLAGPVDTDLGPALIRVNAILAASETTFEDVRDELEAELNADRAGRIISDMRDDIDDLLAGGATIEELGGETEMEAGTIDWRSDVDEGIAAYEEFRTAAQLVEEGDFPELLEIEEGGLFAMRLDEIRPPALQPLDEVREVVAAAWSVDQTSLRLTERAQEAATALEDGGRFEDLDVSPRNDAGLTRDAFIEEAPPGMVGNVFQMEEGDIRVFRTGDGAALVRLDRITQPDPDSEEAQALKTQITDGTAQAIARDALQMFTGRIQSQAGISLNQQAINAVHAQFP